MSERPPRSQSYSEPTGAPRQGAIERANSAWNVVRGSPERIRNSQGSPQVPPPQQQRRSPQDIARTLTASPSMSMSRTTPPPNISLKRHQSRFSMSASPADDVSESGGARPFLHQLKGRVSRSVIKPRLTGTGEEDRVCLDLLKCCTAMDGRYDVTAHATFNGAAQSLLQQPLDILRRAETWQTWWNNLTESSKELQDLARRLYVENSSDRMSDYDQDPMLPIGTSRLHERTQTMLHVWQSPDAAKVFSHAWQWVWQTILEHRIDGINAPFTVMYCIEGTYVTVTSLPPLPAQQPIVLPNKSVQGSLIGNAIESLMAALVLPPDVAGLTVAHGADGRYYLVSLNGIVSHRLPPPFDASLVRPEAVARCLKDNAMTQVSKYVLRTLVPASVEDLAKAVLRFPVEQRSVAELTKDGLLRVVLHANGVNMSLLHHVHLCAQHRFLETHDAAYRSIMDLISTDMVGRVIKQFIRVDIALQASEGRDTRDDRLDVINRIASLLVNKDVTFWADYILPAMRAKFNAPDTYELTFPQVHVPTILRIASSRIGVEYAPDTKRFDRFAEVSGMWMLACRAPDWLGSETPRTAEQLKDYLMSIWKSANVIEAPRVRRVYKMRAFAATVMLNTATAVAKEEYDKLTLQVEAQGPTIETRMDDIFFTAMMLDLRMEHAEKRRLVDRYIKKVSKFPSGCIELDQASITTRYLHAVNVLKSIGDVPPVELIESAFRLFNAIPHTNFPFSSLHAQSLITAEIAVPGLTEQQVGVFVHLVEQAAAILESRHGKLQLAKYLHRAMWSVMDAPLAEGHPAMSKVGAHGYRAQVAAYDVEDNRTAQLAFLTAIFVSRHIAGVMPEAGSLRDSLRRVTESMRAVAAANQIAISRAGISLTLVHRSEAFIRLMEAPPLPAAPHLQDAQRALLDYLKRFGMPLFAALFMQRVGRGYDDRRWMDWLRRNTAAKLLQAVGRGMLFRRYRAFVLYKKKVMKQRTILNRFVQRCGRGYLVRKQYFQLHEVRRVMEGALCRLRLCHRKWLIRRLQRIGRGYLSRLEVSCPYQEEQARRREMEKQRRLQEERDRLSAAAERCRQRMLEVQRKLLEAAWDRLRVCMTDEQRYREQIIIESSKEFQNVARAAQRDLIRIEERASLRKDLEYEERSQRAKEDAAWKEEQRKVDMLQRRQRQIVQETPIAQTSRMLQKQSSSSGGGIPWDAKPAPTGAAAVQYDELAHRKTVQQDWFDTLKELHAWASHCRLQLGRSKRQRQTSYLSDLERRSRGASYNDDSLEAQRLLAREKAAITVQCAWRCNVARFRVRYERLKRERQRRHFGRVHFHERLGPLELEVTSTEKIFASRNH